MEAILDVDGIDGIFIGPNDMSTSLGIPDDYANQEYLAVLEDIIAKSEARGVPVMIHQQTIETSSTAIKLGARFVMHSTDTGLLRSAAPEQMNALREVAGAASAQARNKVETA